MEKLYRVTDAAPARVCGRRLPPGSELALSEAEARYERDLGHLEEVTAEAGEVEPVTFAFSAVIEPRAAADESAE